MADQSPTEWCSRVRRQLAVGRALAQAGAGPEDLDFVERAEAATPGVEGPAMGLSVPSR